VHPVRGCRRLRSARPVCGRRVRRRGVHAEPARLRRRRRVYHRCLCAAHGVYANGRPASIPCVVASTIWGCCWRTPRWTRRRAPCSASLRDSTAAKVEAAAAAESAGRRRRRGASSVAERKAGALFEEGAQLQPAHITDPSVGTQLTAKSADGRERIEALATRSSLDGAARRRAAVCHAVTQAGVGLWYGAHARVHLRCRTRASRDPCRARGAKSVDVERDLVFALASSSRITCRRYVP